MKGEQANQATVAHYQIALENLCNAAKNDGVVLTVDIVSLQPLAMGHTSMHPLARPVWWNSDHATINGQPAVKPAA